MLKSRLMTWIIIAVLVVLNLQVRAHEVTAFYVELRADGHSHEVAMCELPEFSDNLARVFGASWDESKAIQRTVYDAYCDRGEK